MAQSGRVRDGVRVDDAEADREAGRPVGRRAFVVGVGLGVSSLWWGDRLLQAASAASQALPAAVRAALPVGDEWRIYAVNPPFPRFSAASWRLRIDGMVERPQSLSLTDLQRLPRVEQISDFHCVTGWSVPDVRWGGVRFADLLALAAPRSQARALIFESAEEPYVDALTLRQLRAPGAMLATHMDGEPLSRAHGAPVRVVMPQMFGYKGVKWLRRITVSDRAPAGYWEQRGYDRDAWIDGARRS